MKIENIQLKNFRRFGDFTIELDPELTVIIAKNSAGKTAILDAIAIALAPYISVFPSGMTVGIEQEDVKTVNHSDSPENEPIYPAQIITKIDQFPEKMQRSLSGPKSKTTKKESSPLTNLAKSFLERISGTDPFELPVISYYRTARLWKEHSLTTKKTLSESRIVGYRECLSSASNYKDIQQWMAKATIADIQEQQKGKSSLLKPIIRNIENSVNNVLAEQGWNSFSYSIQNESLQMSHEDLGSLPVNRLSDGVRAVVSLCADLSWRCAKLNGHLAEQASALTPGIVLIDEVDIHLHPEWQQTIIPSLRKTFPKIQFIMTTHSPQVLTSIETENIRILEDDQTIYAPQGCLGAESQRLLERLFGVPSRPQGNEIVKLLKEYMKYVSDPNQWEGENPIEIHRKLKEHFGSEEPELLRLDMILKRKQWEARNEKNK